VAHGAGAIDCVAAELDAAPLDEKARSCRHVDPAGNPAVEPEGLDRGCSACISGPLVAARSRRTARGARSRPIAVNGAVPRRSVLGLVVTHYLRELPEGRAQRSARRCVNARCWPKSRRSDLGAHLLLGKGEDTAGGSEAVDLAGAFEAVVAAVYLDSDLATASRPAVPAERIAEAVEGPGSRDYKTHLQELAAARGSGSPATSLATRAPTASTSSRRLLRRRVLRRRRRRIEEAGRAGAASSHEIAVTAKETGERGDGDAEGSYLRSKS
jgi:hypothetical protein